MGCPRREERRASAARVGGGRGPSGREGAEDGGQVNRRRNVHPYDCPFTHTKQKSLSIFGRPLLTPAPAAPGQILLRRFRRRLSEMVGRRGPRPPVKGLLGDGPVQVCASLATHLVGMPSGSGPSSVVPQTLPTPLLQHLHVRFIWSSLTPSVAADPPAATPRRNVSVFRSAAGPTL